jgi:hypothetical protein
LAQPFESTFVLFVDMLGFASLVEEQGEILDDLSPIFTGAELYSPTSAESLLGYRFVNFHRCLNEARFDLQKLGAGTAIVFSDCGFFRIDAIDDTIEIARQLMFRLVDCGVPARMGIAQGTFRMCHAALKSRNFTPLSSIYVRYLTADSLHLNTGMMH